MFKSLSSAFTTAMFSIMSYDDFNYTFIISNLPSPSDDPTALILFILFILVLVANPLNMFSQHSGKNATAKKESHKIECVNFNDDDDLEMSKIAENNNNKAKPPECVSTQTTFARFRIVTAVKNPLTTDKSKSPLTAHQKARRIAYGVVIDNIVIPPSYTDKCYNAIYYENRISQLMNRDPFLFKPRIGSTDVRELIKSAAQNNSPANKMQLRI